MLNACLQSIFTFPQCIGIAGGRPSSSYYFVASQGDHLFYLDPHYTRPAVALEHTTVATPEDDPLATFHCDRIRKMPLSSMDPSMLVGFLCETEDDWLDLKSRIAAMSHKIFALLDRPPTYDDHDGDSELGMQSMSDEESEQGNEDDWL